MSLNEQFLGEKNNDVRVAWNKSLLDEAMKNHDEESFDEVFSDLEIPNECRPSIKHLFYELVASGFMTTEAFIEDCIFWQNTDWPTDREIETIINSIGLFYFWADHYTPNRNLLVTTIATYIEISFDGLTWRMDPNGDFEVLERFTSMGKQKTYFKLSMDEFCFTDVLDQLISNYCQWLSQSSLYQP